MLLSSEIIEVEVIRGDTLHGFARRYLRDPEKWPRIYELNRSDIPDPDRIYPGQIIKVPSDMLRSEIGDLSQLRGDVKYRKETEEKWEKAEDGSRVYPGDSVMTGRNSGARVDFLSGTHLDITSNSLVNIKHLRERPVASLLEGALSSRMTKIITPSAEIIPRGKSVYDVDVDRIRTTRVSVREGEVDVRGQGVSVTVQRGFRTLVELDEEPRIPEALPPPGEDIFSLDEDEYPGGGFHLQVAREREFENILRQDTVAELNEKNIRSNLKPGRYYWRAAFYDRDGFRGEYSHPREVTVSGRPSALLELTGFEHLDRDTGLMRVQGRALNAENVIINGYPASVCGEGFFSVTIINPGEGSVTALAESPEGTVIKRYVKTPEGWKLK